MLLDAEERERARTLVRPEDRSSYIASHVLLRHSLSLMEPLRPCEWQFTRSRNHPPRLAASLKSGLHFSLSHTAGLVACAVWQFGPVGVDVESLMLPRNLAVIDHLALTATEREQLSGMPFEDRAYTRLRLWTLKEAYAKGRGLGLALPFSSIAIDEPRVDSNELQLRIIGDSASKWSAWSFDVVDGLLAVAAWNASGLVPEVMIERVDKGLT